MRLMLMSHTVKRVEELRIGRKKGISFDIIMHQGEFQPIGKG